tara:strand:- start:860 stop:1729 length:870 start_codon:yes stop_codon:yes gene_type:complete
MSKPNTADAMKRHKAGKAGFTDKAHLKAKGLIPRADGTKKKSPKYEDAPANATGTAVAGTGDDSSTIVVKKKRKDDMRDRLFRRFKIKETLDRLVPDLEYPKDEITERKTQLKAMAITSYNANDKSNIQANPVEDKKLAQDPDVKSKDGTQPKKYYKTLSKTDKDKRASHFAKQDYKKSDGEKDYKPAPGDKGAKTKTSKFTKKFKQMYGEDMTLDEAIKGLQNKAKKTGMPYSILKKVYDRGMAAWKGGHRPGTTQQQWAFARVNSFVTKSPGTWGKADSDLAKKVRG